MATAEQKLQQAFNLMQEGKRTEAASIAQEILETDRKNVKAWWLLANLLEDEDGVITCLEQILKIQPNHKAATERLAQIRGEAIPMMNDATASNTPSYTTSKPLPGEVPVGKKTEKSSNNDGIAIEYIVASAAIVVVALVFVIIVQFVRGSTTDQSTPTAAMQSYIDALEDENYRTMRSLTCQQNRESVNVLRDTINNTAGLADNRFSFNQVGVQELNQTETTAIVQVFGEVSLRINDTQTTMDYASFTSLLNAAVSPTVNLINDDGRWVIC